MSLPEREDRRGRGGRRRALRVLGSVVYWLIVLVISLALVVALVLVLESRDESEIVGATPAGSASASVANSEAETAQRSRRANTTIRFAALYSGWQAVSTSRS